MKCFILAGGFATRLWPLTEKRAKPLLPLAGKPILSYMAEQIPRHIPVTVSTNSAFVEQFEHWKTTAGYDHVTILNEDTQSDDHKLGALGAVAQWIRQERIDEDVLLLTGDNYFGFPLEAFLERYVQGTPLIAAYDIQQIELAKAFGTVILDPDSHTVSAFEEKPKEPKTTLVSTGCTLLTRESLPILTEYAKDHPDNVGGIFEELLRNNVAIDCYTFSDPWFDIGSFNAYIEATKALVGEQCICHPSGSHEQSTLEDSVVIGAGSQISNSTLRNVVVFENCQIEDCILEDCIIDNHSLLKGIDLTGKMLREKTALESMNS